MNKPFAGTYVPLHHFRTNWAVVSFMVDIRRDVCLDDGLQPIESGATALNSALAELIDAEGNQRARKTCTGC